LVVPGASALAQHRTGNVSNHAAFRSGAVTNHSFARFNNGTRFSGTRFSGTRFSGTHFRGTRFAHNGRFFRHHRHFRGPFFVGAFAYDDSCWRWHWTPFGLRRHWVCDYDPYW
jgi:Pentapeptide repeats (8 copies)